VLFGMANAPRVHGVLAGVGGVNVSPARIRRLVAEYRDRAAENGPVWME